VRRRGAGVGDSHGDSCVAQKRTRQAAEEQKARDDELIALQREIDITQDTIRENERAIEVINAQFRQVRARPLPLLYLSL
jgi:hypothetical protein